MKPENKKILDDNRCHYETATKAGFVKGFNQREKDNLLRVMREEFQPGYTTDMWCGPCIFDFIKLLYQRYDKWLAEQLTTDHVKANFPSHKTEDNDETTTKDAEPPENANQPENPQGQLHPPHGHHRPKRRARGK